jgi:hypothetical protein
MQYKQLYYYNELYQSEGKIQVIAFHSLSWHENVQPVCISEGRKHNINSVYAAVSYLCS